MLTTEAQRSHREPQRRILRQTPKHEPPTVLPADAGRTNHLRFTCRSYIFLRTQQSPAGAGLFNGFEINAQADSLRYLKRIVLSVNNSLLSRGRGDRKSTRLNSS